jgi:hypothetical protein
VRLPVQGDLWYWGQLPLQEKFLAALETWCIVIF